MIVNNFDVALVVASHDSSTAAKKWKEFVWNFAMILVLVRYGHFRFIFKFCFQLVGFFS